MEEESDSPTVGTCAVFSAADSTASAATIVANSFTNASSVTISRNIGIESTRLLFMGNNFQNGRSDQEIFYDCEDSPTVGRSAAPSGCQLDDPAAIREALERAANATQMLLKNFDKSGGWPSAVTLELTARLVNPKKSTGSPMHGKPVTVQMPLEFNSQSGKIAPCQRRKMVQSKAHKGPVCQCRTHGKRCCPMHTDPGQAAQTSAAPNSGKSAWEQFHPCECALAESSGPPEPSQPAETSQFAACMGSCGDSRPYVCHRDTCCQLYDPDAREVISICYLPVAERDSLSEEALSCLEEKIEEPFVEEKQPYLYESQSDIGVTSESSEYSSEERMERQTPEKAIPPQPQPQPKPEAPPSKRYYLALPQNKDFSNCSPCRFDPSPIMDEEGNVFCPGNCGCCMCPWIKRSLATNWEHINVKVCRCVQRGTIFTKFEDREVCSQQSYFDFCPCREKAEAKYLELYHREMWSRPDAIRGREIQLTEIKELLVPVQRQNE